MKFIQTEDTTSINAWRVELYQRFSAPIDGMWEALYIASSQEYIIEHETQSIGYCCIDEQKSLTQIFLCHGYRHLMDRVIGALIESKLISSAKLSSIEPVSFNACLSYSHTLQKNTLCFQYANRQLVEESSLHLLLASKEDLLPLQTFFKEQLDFDDTFGYTENLIRRKELYMMKKADHIFATGECRLSDSQLDFADIGVIVHKANQGQGLGSQILQKLAQKAHALNRKPICSTTNDNIASQKAIVKAGFYCAHIIFDIHFRNPTA